MARQIGYGYSTKFAVCLFRITFAEREDEKLSSYQFRDEEKVYTDGKN